MVSPSINTGWDVHTLGNWPLLQMLEVTTNCEITTVMVYGICTECCTGQTSVKQVQVSTVHQLISQLGKLLSLVFLRAQSLWQSTSQVGLSVSPQTSITLLISVNIMIIIIIMQVYKAPMSKIKSEARVRAANGGMGEGKTGNTEFWQKVFVFLYCIIASFICVLSYNWTFYCIVLCHVHMPRLLCIRHLAIIQLFSYSVV